MWCVTVHTARPGFSRPSQRDRPFLEILIYLRIIEKGQFITGMHIYVEQGAIRDSLVKSYSALHSICLLF